MYEKQQVSKALHHARIFPFLSWAVVWTASILSWISRSLTQSSWLSCLFLVFGLLLELMLSLFFTTSKLSNKQTNKRIIIMKENNCIQISSDKRNLTRENLHTVKKMKLHERNWISTDSSTEQRLKDQLNCEAYSSFEGVSTDHRIVTAKIQLSLRKNAERTVTTKHYDWALLNNKDIRDKCVLELRNRFETLQEKTEKSTPNDEYENFVNAHLEAAAKCIPTKLKTKYRVPWETLAVREKRALVKTASKNYRKNPTNTNALKLKTAQYQLTDIYIKEQTKYIKNQIDRIRDTVEDRQSRIACQTINEVSRRKNTAKAKRKAANQQERIKLWKQHFEKLLGNPPKITHEPITRIISK